MMGTMTMKDEKKTKKQLVEELSVPFEEDDRFNVACMGKHI